jgi:hypothetical protein
MTDKSSTHQKVIKNGSEGWIVKEVWEKMVSKKQTNGFQAVASTPPEVQIVKQKAKVEELVENEQIVDPVLTGDADKKKPAAKK